MKKKDQIILYCLLVRSGNAELYSKNELAGWQITLFQKAGYHHDINMHMRCF